MKKASIKKPLIIIIDIILLIVSIIAYKYIYEVEVGKQIYSEEAVRFVEENKEPVFKIGKIILYSSANAIDNSNGLLKNFDISQFTDIEIYIDNTTKNKEITAENTISELYIDNIKISGAQDSGEKVINYKNPLECGKYVDIDNFREDGILFKIVNSNKKNQSADYNEPVFYTDCSNPISLGYINKNILTNCELTANSGSISFDGSILRSANIGIENLKTTISFTIHLKNNYNEEFVCNVKIDNDLESEEENDGIYTGYIMKIIENKEDEYNFLKTSNR